MTKIEFVKGAAYELDPSKKYLLVFNNRIITKKDISNLQEYINNLGIKSISICIDGVPEEMIKVIEQPNDPTS